MPLFALDGAQTRDRHAASTRTTCSISRPFGKQSVPELQAGAGAHRRHRDAAVVPEAAARCPSTRAARTSRCASSRRASRSLSTHHYVNHGGSEMVVYRATPADVRRACASATSSIPASRPRAPASTAPTRRSRSRSSRCSTTRRSNTPIVAFARDEAGNEAKATFVDNVFEKPFKKSRIEIDDKFIEPRRAGDHRALAGAEDGGAGRRTVPRCSPGSCKSTASCGSINADEIAALAAKTSPTTLWNGPFVQLGNSKVEASFADHRTYVYKGKEVDQQVHLGFDLAVTAHVPVARRQRRHRRSTPAGSASTATA